ncbi:hypothetical protein [Leptospira santarosai]|uniref:hypothetical protein n=1 Tax=Leptospira santarosai TaxID=28183 RepID=UPI000A89CC9A|nr:hypothetical protein [Leptospira santarosai]
MKLPEGPRLLRRSDSSGGEINPLEILIDKMKKVLNNPSIPNYHSCYELGIAEGEYDLPLYNTTGDSKLLRGGPCLSHLSFKIFGGKLHLTAIYRSHDYRLKVPGNLLGLARLQKCVATEIGIQTGSLTVHSTYAFIEKKDRKKLKDMSFKIDNILREREFLRDATA